MDKDVFDLVSDEAEDEDSDYLSNDGSYRMEEEDEEIIDEQVEDNPPPSEAPALTCHPSVSSGTTPPMSPQLDQEHSEFDVMHGESMTRGPQTCQNDVDEVNELCEGVQAGMWYYANSLVVTLAIDTSRFYLDAERATAWGLRPEFPVVIQMDMDKNYTEASYPARALPSFQLDIQGEDLRKRNYDRKLNFGLSWVVQDRLERYIKECWPGSLLRTITEERVSDEEVIADIVECCGVERELAEFALKRTQSRTYAMELLNDERRKAKLETELKSMEEKMEPDDPLVKLLALFPDLETDGALNVLDSCCHDLEVAKQILLENGLVPCGTVKDIYPEPPVLQSTGSTFFDAVNQQREKESKSEAYNYLVRIIHFVEDKMRTVNLRCLICDSLLEYKGLIPVVCPSELCIHGYEQYSLGIDLDSRIIENPEVTDLLISMLYSATHGGRIELMFPTQVSACEKNFLEPNGENSINKLRDVLKKVPAVDSLREWALAGVLRQRLDELDALIYPLLRWVVASNRSHIRLLRVHERIKDIECDEQFLLLTGPLEREQRFQNMKEETRRNPGRYESLGADGSIHAFHGSALGNWHSIMRLGLKVMSNTKYMSAGAAYGKGIYFAEHIHTSLGYCGLGTGSGWPHSKYGAKPTFMALCEIVDRPKQFTHVSRGGAVGGIHGGGIHVVPEEDFVMTRYFLVNPKNCKNTSRNLSIPGVNNNFK